jgi:oligopeptide/dipeptide ABC transporter ATP-binding protein
LDVKNLSVSFKTEKGVMKAVDGVSFSIGKGEIAALVGESGCGKSATAHSIMRLYDEKREVRYGGEIFLNGENILRLPTRKMRQIRGKDIALAFQDALSALNPAFTVGNQIEESLKIHTNLNKRQRRKRAVELLSLVGVNSPEERADQYAFEFSGGMRQRGMIATALACQPKLLIADEPTTALDATIQAQILDLLLELNKKLNMGILLITHDLSVVAQTCNRVVVMYLGQIVEEAPAETLFDFPVHPYTQGLIRSIPKIEGNRPPRLYTIEGTVPLLNQIPKGCRFAPRCPEASERCRESAPELISMNESQKVRCYKRQRLRR